MISQQLRQPKPSVQWCTVSLNQFQQQTPRPLPEADTWVQLLESFNSYCEGEALLLCPISDEEWAAWLPSQGETVINIRQFCIPYV